MSERPTDRVTLSGEGLRRKRSIEAALLARAAHRRTGRTALAAAACIALLLSAAIAVRSAFAPPTRTPSIVDRTLPSKTPHPQTTPSPAPLALSHIRIVTNAPLPDRPCTPPTGSAPTSSGICILNDAQLISALSQTGQSYGIVRVGGAIHVVSNSGSQ